MPPNTEEITFVVALPNWEVLYYLKGDFKAVPVIAWGVSIDAQGITQIRAVAAHDDNWPLAEERPLCSPDGDVSYGVKNWPTVWDWLAEMKGTDAKPELAIPRAPTTGVAVLDSFRNRFAKLSSTDN